MPHYGNPQHNARKRAARDRHRAAHDAGFFQRKARDVDRLRRAVAKNEAAAAVLFAAIMKPDAPTRAQ